MTLKGRYGVLISFQPADAHTCYQGSTDISSNGTAVLELRKVMDTSGSVQWAIGLARMPCFRMAFVDKPVRLVVDFAA